MKKVFIATALVIGTALAAPGYAADAQALATTKNCMACHGIDKKILGPAYKDVAKKYAGDATAEAKLADKIIKGGGGVWGPIPMPANKVTPEEATTLVKWVLSQK